MRDLKGQKKSRVKENRRRREKQPRDWGKIFRRTLRFTVFVGSLVLVTSGSFIGLRMIFSSDYFRLETIQVEQAQRVSEEEILALSDIQPGTSIFDLDLALIGSKNEENLWISRVQVERVLPRSVVIRVEERKPLAIVSLGYLYYMDAEGTLFKVLESEDRLDYPVITGIDRSFLLEKPEESRKLLREAVGLIRILQARSRFGLEDVSELHLDPASGIDLFTYVGGVPVHMGHANYELKLDRLEEIYKELEPRLPGLKYIDLNVLDRVIVKVDNRTTTQKG